MCCGSSVSNPLNIIGHMKNGRLSDHVSSLKDVEVPRRRFVKVDELPLRLTSIVSPGGVPVDVSPSP